MEWVRGHFGHPPPPPPASIHVDPICLDHTDDERRRSLRERQEAFRRVRRLEESWRLTMELKEIEQRGEQANG